MTSSQGNSSSQGAPAAGVDSLALDCVQPEVGEKAVGKGREERMKRFAPFPKARTDTVLLFF